jgi:ABC-type nitrate/sulfonate/bicarbonate transport system permease component
MMPAREARWKRRLLILVLALGIWEARFRLGAVNPVIVGSPSSFLQRRSRTGRLSCMRSKSPPTMLVATAIAWTGGIAAGRLWARAGVVPASFPPYSPG